ncbi:50S ribosomal protein L10 [Candidatus Marinimicrobia bacterium MT.SAG.3]|nr:50S ribosomal protein L10 [Candidatus Marinimicrobia bacterium MT.SAG.3]
MPNAQKIEAVKELVEKLSRAKGIYLADFTGLTVQEAVEFRRKLKENGIEYRVAKNTLIKIAAKEAKIEGLSEYLVGPTGIALSYDDPASPAKIFYDFAKENEKMNVKACWMEGEMFGAEKFVEIAKLPPERRIVKSPYRGFAESNENIGSNSPSVDVQIGWNVEFTKRH